MYISETTTIVLKVQYLCYQPIHTVFNMANIEKSFKLNDVHSIARIKEQLNVQIDFLLIFFIYIFTQMKFTNNFSFECL